VVVWLYDSSSDLRSRGDSERKLGLSAVVNRETLKQEGAETRSSSSTSGMENHETLKTSAVISKLADSVKDKVNNFLSNSVVTTCVVVGSIFLSGDDLLRMVQLAVSSSADFVTHSRLKIDQDSTRNMLSSTSLREEGVEGIITTTDGLVRRHLTIRLNAVLKAVKFPASVTGLDTSLTDVNRKALSHF